MKKLLVFVLIVVVYKTVNAISYPLNRTFDNSGLREHVQLIIEISNLKILPCPQCNAQGDNYSYTVTVKDAKLGISFTSTAMGKIYNPYLEDFVIEKKGFSLRDRPIEIPREGVYVGSIWKECVPWAIGADGSCRAWEVKYEITGKVN